MTEAVIVDIDGTLADCSHRREHVANGRKNWPAFFALMADDTIIAPIRRLCEVLSDMDVAVVLCSGRPEGYREVTEAWLKRECVPYRSLYMRPEDDTRADYIVKAQLLAGIRQDGYEPFLVVDDRQSVVDMWRDNGLICLQCAPGNFETEGKPGNLILMVGPSGAGKTTWLTSAPARAMGIHPSHVISSDQLRADLCGDFRSQARNDDVFRALHAQARTRLRHGLPTVIDAMNLRRKDRIACVDCAPAGSSVTYVVLDRLMEEKRRDAGWRAEVRAADGQPFDLLAKHAETFRAQLKDILSGDKLPHVTVRDLRIAPERSAA